MYQWHTIRWPKLERKVWKLQKRMDLAAKRGEHRQGRRLQQLLLRSYHAKLLAVRQVTQDNRGKQTPGVDGLAALTPPERLALANTLPLDGKAAPVRRVYIPKPGTDEQRPLGIPTRADRAKQGVVKYALEPAGEAQFALNSYGVRPGRSTGDALGAIDVQINQKPPWVLDADIATWFDRIDHAALLRKLNAPPTVSRQIKAWLKAGILDKGHWFPTTAGTPQGGVASPLFANMALHGLEEIIHRAFPGRGAPDVLRYADDLVVLHPTREKSEPCQALLAEQLGGMGWAWKPSKTRLTHTLKGEEGMAGVDFLSVPIRQSPTKPKRGAKTIRTPSRRAMAQPQRQIIESVRRHRTGGQARLIAGLNPMIRGWSHYCSTIWSKKTFAHMDEALRQQLRAWIRVRHPNSHRQWGQQRYWRRADGRLRFTPPGSGRRLAFHVERPIRRHVKVRARRSPYDGDEVYWRTRRGYDPGVSARVATLLKRQAATGRHGGGDIKPHDVLEVDPLIPRVVGGSDAYTNWQWLPRYGHVAKTARERQRFA